MHPRHLVILILTLAVSFELAGSPALAQAPAAATLPAEQGPVDGTQPATTAPAAPATGSAPASALLLPPGRATPLLTVPETGTTKETLREMTSYLVVILVLGAGAIVVVRKVLPRLRIAAPAAGRQVRVVETAALGPRKALHLVQVGSRRLLLASSAEGIRFIQDVTESAGAFADVQRQADQRLDGEGQAR